MPRKEPLFLLIKSLSKSEKRYFKMQASMQGGQNKNYRELFETLDGMEHYDEKAVRQRFGARAFSRQLHVTKNYLHQQIMKSLRNFYLKVSLEARLKSLLLDIEILFKRDLLESCMKSIIKAEKLARNFDHHLGLLEVLQWKRRVLLSTQGVGSNEALERLMDQETLSLNALQHQSTYWQLTINVSERFGDSGFETFLLQPHMKDHSLAITYRSRILYYHLLYTAHTILGHNRRAEAAIDQLIEYLESNHMQIREDPSPYLTALNNKIGFYLNNKQLDRVSSLLDKVKGIPENFDLKNQGRITMKLLMRAYNIELEVYRDSKAYERGVGMIPSIRDFLEKYQEHVPREYKVLFHYQFAYLYFMVGRYTLALKDINVILAQRYSEVRNDIVGFAHFLNLIIHYELGNITVLRYAVESTRRFLKKRGGLQEFEKSLLKFFSKISTKPVAQHRELLNGLRRALLGPPPVLTANQLDYLDFDSWLDVKLGSPHRKDLA